MSVCAVLWERMRLSVSVREWAGGGCAAGRFEQGRGRAGSRGAKLVKDRQGGRGRGARAGRTQQCRRQKGLWGTAGRLKEQEEV